MKLSEHQREFTKHIGLLIEYATSMNIELTFGEATRTDDQQALYFYGYAIVIVDGIPRLKKAKKRSKTLLSNHLKRMAVDFNFFIDDKLTYTHPRLELLGVYWEELSELNRWGGFFKSFADTPHFERNI